MKKNRKDETKVYVVCWIVVVTIYLLDVMRARASIGGALFDSHLFLRMTQTLLPYLLLFLVNNYILIPRLLLRNRLRQYLLFGALSLIAIWAYQYFDFINHSTRPPEPVFIDKHNHPRPLLPLPLVLDFSYGLLVMGCNLAVALLFQRYEDRFESESLKKANAENELASLKAQINPHFYMNMLNNIHGMIEIDPVKAQKMVIDMSGLMRYMLYESSKPMAGLSDEVGFMRRYLDLMRIRYPENKVRLSVCFPPEKELRGIQVPPLLFLVFLENAFKHGISYRNESFVDVSLQINGRSLIFKCSNSCFSPRERGKESGIGLVNVSQRLSLIYGKEASMKVDQSGKQFDVTLNIPIDETENHNN